MYVFDQATQELRRWIRNEVEFERPLARGDRGSAVRRCQEWLNLHGLGIVVDGDFGLVTERALERFQKDAGLGITGRLDEEAFNRLVYPMVSVLNRRPAASRDIGQVITEYARCHLEQHPLEIGGQNRGPWVRLYMQGNDGPAWPWCAGFVSFLLHQAVETLEVAMPIDGSYSCDSLAAQAKEAGLFFSENGVRRDSVAPGSIFLVRRTSSDWTHTGVVTSPEGNAFDTIEGNTNDDGDREGYEVCSRSRAYQGKDFVIFE